MSCLNVATCHGIGPMAYVATLVHNVECPRANIKEREATPHLMPLWPRITHHTCYEAHMCLLASSFVCHGHTQGHDLVAP